MNGEKLGGPMANPLTPEQIAASIKLLGQQISALVDRVDELEADVKAHEATNTSNDKIIAALQKTVIEQGKRLDALEKKKK
jgi:uncharacterized coiled-coil protein SlyX